MEATTNLTRTECRRRQTERSGNVISGEVGSTAGEQIVEVGFEGSQSITYAKIDKK